jgi:hypothetical protein
LCPAAEILDEQIGHRLRQVVASKAQMKDPRITTLAALLYAPTKQ